MRNAAIGGLSLITPMFFAQAAQAQDLNPPPPMDSPGMGSPPTQPTTESTQRSLDDSEKEDSGRGLEWVWLNAEVGGSYVNFESFSSDKLALQRTSDGGPMFGLGAGVRLLVFTAGARLRLNQFSAFNLWEINGELGLHIPLGRLDPYVALHGGYAFVGTLSDSSVQGATGTSSNDVSVHGFDAGLSVGGDYYFTSLISLGLDLGIEALFLKRPPVALPPNLSAAAAASAQSNPLYADSGSSVGLGLGGSLHFGLHF